MYLLKRNIFFFFLLLILIFLCSCQKSKVLFINDKRVYIEIADSPRERAKGLMFRNELKKDHGMLFIFERNKITSFWMKNTFIPLSIAFIDINYRIVHITDMSPLDEGTSHSSIYPIKYALEMDQGWFKRNNIKIGDVIKGFE